MKIMTYQNYARRTCRCRHPAEAHRLVKGSCKSCACVMFSSIDGYSAERALVVHRRLHDPNWWIKALAVSLLWVIGLGLWMWHAGTQSDDVHGLNGLFIAFGYVFLTRLAYRIGRWAHRKFVALGKDRPYDRVQLERIEREAK